MRKGKKIILLKWAVLLIVFAMVWLSLGSLVNFHQHRLYGKILLSELVAYTPHKKTVNASDIHKSLKCVDFGFSGDQSGDDLKNASHYAVYRCILLQGSPVNHYYIAEAPRSTGLRAPPTI